MVGLIHSGSVCSVISCCHPINFSEALKKLNQEISSPVKVLCFASYNSPRLVSSGTAFNFRGASTLGFKDILLCPSEFEELINDFNSRNSRDLMIGLEGKKTILELSNLHVGFITRTMYKIYSQQIADQEIPKYLRSSLYYFDVRQARGALKLTAMNDVQKQAILHLQTHNGLTVMPNSPIFADIFGLIKCGVVIPRDNNEFIVDFTSPIVAYCAKVALIEMIPTHPKTDNINSFQDLLLATLAKFDHTRICNTLALSVTDGKPLETVWSMEWYRTACECLSTTTFISPGLPDGHTSVGWVDFAINSNKWWLIELLCEGTKNTIDEHLSRFSPPNGCYMGLFKPNQVWAVVDFRSTAPSERHPNLFSVVYTADYKTYVVYNNSPNPLAIIKNQ